MKKKTNKRMEIIVLLIVAVVTSVLLILNFSQGEQKQKDIIQGKVLGANNGADSQEYDYGTEKGTVKIRYLDEGGEELATEESQQGIIGTRYETSRKKINYYISDGHEPVNKIGDYKDGEIIVTYYYKPVSETVNVEKNDNEITVKVQNVLEDKEYELLLEQESTDGVKLTGGKFTMIDAKDSNELMNGTTVNGGLTLGAVNIGNEVDEQYEIEENEAPSGYLKAIRDDNKRFKMRLTRVYNSVDKEYELKASSGDTEFDLEEDEENNQIIVKVVNEKIKLYDLAIQKVVSSVDGVQTNASVEVSVNNQGEVVYSKTQQNLSVKDAQKLVYTIKVFNGGNEDMSAPVITESLPKGLKFLPESTINIENGWSIENGVLKTSKLVGETIAGVDAPSENDVQFKTLYLEV